MSRLFIVTVASEKGGVGKTTIATNLAVYLKALHEELPVTIASFDNHFSIDHMFALGPRPTAGMAEFMDGAQVPDLVTLGQYGVQYIASSRRLTVPAEPPARLRPRLEDLGLDGILILDTRPILDWFTEAAILAADLVLTPVKDRAALVNAAALRAVLQRIDCAGRLWLVPSLVDARARLNADVRVSDYLAFAARERDYQVAEVMISKSPRVESLSSGFSTRIRPVLTHARQTAVHGQLRDLAEFVLAQRAAAPVEEKGQTGGELSALARRRRVESCPVCTESAPEGSGHPFFDLRSRRRGALHPACFRAVLRDGETDCPSENGGLLVLELSGPGLVDEAAQLQLHRFDEGNRLVAAEQIADPTAAPFKGLIEGVTGRGWHEQRREWIFLAAGPQASSRAWSAPGESQRRRNILRVLFYS